MNCRNVDIRFVQWALRLSVIQGGPDELGGALQYRALGNTTFATNLQPLTRKGTDIEIRKKVLNDQTQLNIQARQLKTDANTQPITVPPLNQSPFQHLNQKGDNANITAEAAACTVGTVPCSDHKADSGFPSCLLGYDTGSMAGFPKAQGRAEET
jgi:hypothetical protein